MRNRDMPDGGHLPDRLHRFADIAASSSPLYERLARASATEPIVLDILGEAPHGQPAANILLAAVQYLMLDGIRHPLEGHYPSVGQGTATGDPEEPFFDFCATHRDRLVEIVTTRTVQTNEVRRCTILLPAFSWVTIGSGRNAPLALLEIGPSTGLNLMFDRYRYDFGDGRIAGDPDSPLTLSTDLRGTSPPLPRTEVVWRRGIDLHPLDVSDPSDVRWGRAQLWPEQLERIDRYEKAVAIAATNPPTLVEGDALEVLPGEIESAPESATLVLFHSFVLNQFTESERSQLGDLIAAASRHRPIDRISIELLSRAAEFPEIVHTSYRRGAPTSQVLGTAHHHGEWLRWEAHQ